MEHSQTLRGVRCARLLRLAQRASEHRKRPPARWCLAGAQGADDVCYYILRQIDLHPPPPSVCHAHQYHRSGSLHQLMPQGFTRTANGFRAWIRVSSKHDEFNELRTQRFDLDATVQQIRDWRKDTRTELRRLLDAHRQRRAEANGTAGTFREDARQRYMPAVRAMTSYTERERDIGVWIDEFGDRDRRTIRPYEIRAARDRWLTVGPKRRWQKVNGIGQWIDVAEPLAASTVNHRLRALSNLWTVLDGKRAPNPVREVPEADEPAAVPRALDYETIRAISNAMSDQGRALRGEKRMVYSLAKARVGVLAWTGMTPKELSAITEPDIQWDEALLLVPARRKGRGVPGRIVPLGPEGLAALREFDRLDAYGRFERRVVLRAWQRACRIVLGRTVRLYDLRHSFVTAVVRATKDLGLAGRLAGHVDQRTTSRYALAAIMPTLRAGIDAFTASVAPKEKPE